MNDGLPSINGAARTSSFNTDAKRCLKRTERYFCLPVWRDIAHALLRAHSQTSPPHHTCSSTTLILTNRDPDCAHWVCGPPFLVLHATGQSKQHSDSWVFDFSTIGPNHSHAGCKWWSRMLPGSSFTSQVDHKHGATDTVLRAFREQSPHPPKKK